MARTDINKTVHDLQSDDGAILLSLIQGEQREYPVTLNFLTNAYGYTYEAVLIEANNVSGSESIPTTIAVDAVKNTLTVRVPPERGAWSAVGVYNREDVVLYSSVYYKLNITTVDYTSATIPSSDPKWEVYIPNKVYVQFPKTLSIDYAVEPTADVPVYSFFELSVTEPMGTIYRKIWKPVRGIVEFAFSPTELVP